MESRLSESSGSNGKIQRTYHIFLSIVLMAMLSGCTCVHWDGGAPCTFEISVLDRGNKPVKNATVVLKYANFSGDLSRNQDLSDHILVTAKTDSDGNCEITHPFGAGGKRCGLYKTGSISFSGKNIKITHGNFQSVEVPISQFTGEHCSTRHSRNFPIKIELTQSPLSPSE